MSDCELILKELKRGNITAESMWRKYGIQRCGARIWDLRERGFIVETIKRQVPTKRGGVSTIAEYELKEVA